MSIHSKNFIQKIGKAILAIGPGIFAIGYTVGTGSVTSMLVAGSTYGMQLLWVLLLSCYFSGVLIYVYGNYSLITGETALFSFRKRLKYGRAIGILIIIGILLGQWNSLIGIVGISSNILFELLKIYWPGIADFQYQSVLIIALVIVSSFYLLLIQGSYTFFEKILIVFVSIMGLSFLLSLFLVYPLPIDVIKGVIPKIPQVEGGSMMVAAFVGTTMAAATFLSRPLFIKGKGWTKSDLTTQKKDAISAAVLIFVISGAIMAVACGALYYDGSPIQQVSDMPDALVPIAGKFAITLFFFGTLSAGLSSIFPILLIVPLLIADYKSGELDTTSRQFRYITAVASVLALIIPIFGANPIDGQILSQVFNVFVLPLVIIGILIILNLKSFRSMHKTALWINISLVAALVFSLVISYNGIVAIGLYFN
ncbi:MAG: Nramp family divalent metal transporter [Saprospiraceae bacterium]|nr:Nramp family divalent metal transporter [Saprospiraceae bacterium]